MKKKTNDYENFEKGMIYMKILKKGGGGSREKGGGGNEIHAPFACDKYMYCIVQCRRYCDLCRKYYCIIAIIVLVRVECTA